MRKKYEYQISFDDFSFTSLDKIFPADDELEKMSAALDENPEILDEVSRDLQCGLRHSVVSPYLALSRTDSE